MPAPERRAKKALVLKPVGRAKAKSATRTDTRQALNMRVRPELRSLIDHAAELTGKNRTDFVLDAARQAAQDAILDQTVIQFSPKAFAAFVAMLDAPPNPNERLRKTMQVRPSWE